MEDKKKVLFATLYHYESIINSLTELQNVETLVLFVDREDEVQTNSYEVIEKVAKVGKIKILKEKFNVTDFSAMFKKIDKLVDKFKDYDIYVDISQSVRLKAIGLINYFSINYPPNFRRMTFYAPWLHEIIEIPIFKAQPLNESEDKALKYISKSSMFMVGDLAKHLNCSVTHAYRIINILEEQNYIQKTSEGYKLTIKGKVIV